MGPQIRVPVKTKWPTSSHKRKLTTAVAMAMAQRRRGRWCPPARFVLLFYSCFRHSRKCFLILMQVSHTAAVFYAHIKSPVLFIFVWFTANFWRISTDLLRVIPCYIFYIIFLSYIGNFTFKSCRDFSHLQYFSLTPFFDQKCSAKMWNAILNFGLYVKDISRMLRCMFVVYRGAVASFMRNWTSTSCVVFTFHSIPIHSHTHNPRLQIFAIPSTTSAAASPHFHLQVAFPPSLSPTLSLSVSTLSVTCKCCCILHYCHDITACGIAFESYQTGAKNVVKQCRGREEERKEN